MYYLGNKLFHMYPGGSHFPSWNSIHRCVQLREQSYLKEKKKPESKNKLPSGSNWENKTFPWNLCFKVKNTHSVLEPMRKPIIFPPLVFPEPVNSNGRMKFLKIWVRIQSFGKKKWCFSFEMILQPPGIKLNI